VHTIGANCLCTSEITSSEPSHATSCLNWWPKHNSVNCYIDERRQFRPQSTVRVPAISPATSSLATNMQHFVLITSNFFSTKMILMIPNMTKCLEPEFSTKLEPQKAGI